MKSIPAGWQQAGLTDEDGELRPLLDSDSVFFLPPGVTLKESKYHGEPTLSVIYPVPSRFMTPMRFRATSEELGSKLTLSALPQNGWTVKRDADGLLGDFLKLEH